MMLVSWNASPRFSAYSSVCGFSVAEDLRRQDADDAGDAMAIDFQRLEVGIRVVFEVHRHAVDDFLEPRFLEPVWPDDFGERARHRVLRLAVIDACRPPCATTRAWSRATPASLVSSTTSSTSRQYA